jgi:hypothetical protein
LSREGITEVFKFALYARVAVMQLIRLPGDTQDSIFVSSERYQFAVLRWDAASGEIRTSANGNVKDKIGRPRESGQICCVDPGEPGASAAAVAVAAAAAATIASSAAAAATAAAAAADTAAALLLVLTLLLLAQACA